MRSGRGPARRWRRRCAGRSSRTPACVPTAGRCARFASGSSATATRGTASPAAPAGYRGRADFACVGTRSAGENARMESLRGQLLIASPKILDPNFRRVVVYMAEHTEDGAMGLVLNRPAETTIGEAVPDLEGLAGGGGAGGGGGGPGSAPSGSGPAPVEGPARAA